MSLFESSNPWLSVWWHPRKTVEQIALNQPKRAFFLLSFLYGLPMVLNFAQSYSFIELLPFWAILLFTFLVSPLIGMLGLSISAYVLYGVGKLLEGKGSFLSVRAALAWSNVPNILTISLWILLLGMFQRDLFSQDFMNRPFTGMQSALLFFVFLMESIAAVWGFVILLVGLSQVQGFSTWKALLNVLLPILVLFLCFWSINFIFN